jgi:hypothetical protein
MEKKKGLVIDDESTNLFMHAAFFYGEYIEMH